MKIVCDSCGTKYSISDEKVRGKVFKIRCKKCSHIIVVRGTNETAAAATPAIAATNGAAPADAGWHLVVDGDQVGPVPESDIRGRIERGEINAETYVWKEGFADWLKLSAIPEFASLVTPAEAGVFADGTGSGAVNGDAAAHAPAGGGLFGGAPTSDDADVFGGLASAAAKRGGDLFASPLATKPAAEESRWPRREPHGTAPRKLGALLALESAVARDASARGQAVPVVDGADNGGLRPHRHPRHGGHDARPLGGRWSRLRRWYLGQ
jgi:predicted Zn finger-like uncharacterized protein